jgi:hypothetical protein
LNDSFGQARRLGFNRSTQHACGFNWVSLTPQAGRPIWTGLAGRFHALKGDLKGHYAVWVDENWRLTFTFDGKDAELIDYQDYH